MKKWIFILSICSSSAIKAQEAASCPEFYIIMRDAEQAEKEGDFRNAILRYNAAERCNPAISTEIDRRILHIFDKIDQLRKKAESAHRAAEREKIKALSEASKARIAEKAANKFRYSASLAATAQRWQWENPTLAIRLAEVAFQIHPGDEAREAMNDILSYEDNTFYYKEILTGSPVEALALAPDASLFVTGNNTGVCQIREINGKQLHEFKAHEGPVIKLVFSPKGQYFVSAGADSLVHFWDLKGQLIRSLPKQKANVRDIAIAPDGSRLATCTSSDSTALVWGSDGAFIHQLTGHKEGVNAVAFSPEGGLVATGSSDNTAIVWTQSGTVLKKFESASGIFGIAFSPDGKDILLGSGKPQIWRFQENQSFVFNTNYDPISSVTFSPDGQLIATNNILEPEVTIWQANGIKYRTLNGHAAGTSVRAIAFSPDYRTVITAGTDGSIKFWDIYANLQMTYNQHDSYINAVAFSPDGSTVATASADMAAKVWAINGQELQTLSAHTDKVNDIAFSPNGNQLLTGSDDKTAILWGLDGSVINTLKGHTGGISAVAFSKNGEWILTASEDSTARIWDKNGKTILVFKGHQASVSGIQMAPDGIHILTGSWDGTIRLWNVNGQEKMVLRPESTGIKSVAISPDGAIAAVTNDETFMVWDAQGKEIFRRVKQPGTLFSIAFSTDGKSLITGNSLGHVVLWDLSGRKVATLRNHEGIAASIVCSPDGNYVLVPGGPGGGDTASLYLMPAAWLRYGIAPMAEEDIVTFGIREFLEDYGK